MKPRCYQCNEKPARKLNVGGEYGEVVLFCSLRCAAREAITGPMVRNTTWCQKHNLWFEPEDGPCYECQRANT